LRLLLEERLELEVVGEAADNQELLIMLEDLRPDIVLLDWDLPGLSTAAPMDALLGIDHQAKLLVLGAQPESRPAALAAGADGFVSKADPPRRLLAAIRALMVEGES
jgi:DNA-binding NarL/FixJ family response regulator